MPPHQYKGQGLWWESFSHREALLDSKILTKLFAARHSGRRRIRGDGSSPQYQQGRARRRSRRTETPRGLRLRRRRGHRYFGYAGRYS